MEAIKKLNVEAFKYLDAIPHCNWSRHAFSTSSKSGMLLNNCCESFNNVLREARTKPIISLMEWIKRYIMQRCCAKRDGLKSFDGLIMPSVVKMIEKGMLHVTNIKINQADLHEFEVDQDGDTYVVNLQTRECGCYRWSLMGIPCWHALACIVKRRLNYEDFVHQAYHVSTYAATYTPAFKAMPGHKQWETTSLPHPLRPPYRVMPGRPSKKKRVKEPGEAKDKQMVKRAKTNNKCSRCGRLGHYKPKCQNVPLKEVDKEGKPSSTATTLTTNAETAPAARQPTTSTVAVPRQSTAHKKAPKQGTTAALSAKKATKPKKGASAKTFAPKKRKKTLSVSAILSSQAFSSKNLDLQSQMTSDFR